jgi:ABC-type transport system involved in multi-copper enzyme maturation permease subunit
MDNKISVLFFNTFQKEYRNKMMIFFIIITVILIFGINSFLNFAGNLPGMIPRGTLSDKKLFVFFYTINLWNILLSIIVGVNCLKSDIKSGVILQILSFPIKRTHLLFARILGGTALVLAYYFLAFLLAVVVFTFSSDGGASFNFKMLLGLFPTSALILSTVTITVLLSLYLSKIQSLFAALFSMVFIGHYNNFFSGLTLGESVKDLGFLKFFGLIFHIFLPRVGFFDELSKDVILGNPINSNFWIEIPHFLASYAILALICHYALKRKEF